MQHCDDSCGYYEPVSYAAAPDGTRLGSCLLHGSVVPGAECVALPVDDGFEVPDEDEDTDVDIPVLTAMSDAALTAELEKRGYTCTRTS